MSDYSNDSDDDDNDDDVREPFLKRKRGPNRTVYEPDTAIRIPTKAEEKLLQPEKYGVRPLVQITDMVYLWFIIVQQESTGRRSV